MRRLSLVALASLSACTLPGFDAWKAGPGSTSSGGSTWGDSSEPFEPSTGDPSEADTAVTAVTAGSRGDSTSLGTDTGEDGPPLVEPEKPEIVSVELPAKVYAAGPVPLAVQAEHTASVQVLVDGADIGDLILAGDGLFTGDLPVRGAVDNGSHTVEVIAKQGKYQATRSPSYFVETPTPGSEAWTMEGPPGSRSNRVAVAAAGHLVVVGQTDIAGTPRPSLQLRSSATGAELSPETILDTREGAAADVAVLADGRMWVAMNVREANKDPRARFVLLDADGTSSGIEVMGATGRVVRAIAADPEGGCFAVGVASYLGDWDVAYWRIDGDGTQRLGDMYDYYPAKEPHSFVDLANDVVLDGDLAYIVGMTTGKHNAMDIYATTRGMVVAMNRHSGEVLAPLIAPAEALFKQSAFFGATRHVSGVLVTGYGSDLSDSMYRIETSLYSLSDGRTLHLSELPNDGLAYGSDVALDSQGRALVVGSVTQDGKRQAVLIARMANAEGTQMFTHWFAGGGPSEGLGIARDAYDRIFPVGYFTTNGEELARIKLIHG